ncbi:MAG: HD domain-containing protein [Bacilli bacterium]|nr:HD domain-containing protein [Bacilli bacterium]
MDNLFYNIETIKTDLKRMLKEHRYNHSLLVADEAKKLATIYHIDEDKCYLTGLIHDMAKNLSEEENNNLIKKYNLSEEWYREENKPILHAELGYYLAKEKYNCSEDICRAIKYHTIGNDEMTTMEKIIFIADKTARENLNDNLLYIKELSYQDLDLALLKLLEGLENKLSKSNTKLAPITKQLMLRLQRKEK